MDIRALELGIPEETAISPEIRDDEPVTRNFLRGYATALVAEGCHPGFKANADAKFAFDREFSQGMQTDREVFKKCLIWTCTK